SSPAFHHAHRHRPGRRPVRLGGQLLRRPAGRTGHDRAAPSPRPHRGPPRAVPPTHGLGHAAPFTSAPAPRPSPGPPGPARTPTLRPSPVVPVVRQYAR